MERSHTQPEMPPRLPYLDVRFHCRLKTDALFSAYKGSMLRGSLGANLRRGLCMTRSRDCAACILAKNCIYPRIFSPLPAQDRPAPPPFCLEPDLDARREYQKGENFGFNLKLFSFCVDYLPFFAQALRMAGEKGMGDPAKAGRFAIEDITCQGKSILDAENDNLNIPAAQLLPLPCAVTAAANDRRIALQIESPLRHKSGNQFSTSLQFHELFHLILRRAKALYLIAGLQWRMNPEEYGELLAAAQAVRIAQNDLHWHDWTRYSSRQEAYMKFGGISGSIVYEGDLSPFGKLLQFAEIAHIGKQTSFGLGRIKISQV